MNRIILIILSVFLIFSCNKIEKNLAKDIKSLETKYEAIVKNAGIAAQGDVEKYEECIKDYIVIKKLHNKINSAILELTAKGKVAAKKIENYKAMTLNATTKNYVKWISSGLYDMSFFKKEDVKKINSEIYPEE